MDTHWLRKLKKQQLIALILEMDDERTRLQKVLEGFQENECEFCIHNDCAECVY